MLPSGTWGRCCPSLQCGFNTTTDQSCLPVSHISYNAVRCCALLTKICWQTARIWGTTVLLHAGAVTPQQGSLMLQQRGLLHHTQRQEELRNKWLMPRHWTRDNSWLSSGTCFAAQRAITPPLHLLTLQSQEKPRWLCWLVTLPVLVARMGKGTFPALALGVCFIFLALVPSGWLLAAVDGGFYFSSLLYPPWEKLLQL